MSGVKFTTARLVAEKTLQLIYRRHLKPFPAPKSTEPPPTLPYLHLKDFDELCRTNQGAAVAHLKRLVDEESVIHLEDLILRRTDWGTDPTKVEAVARKICGLMGWSQPQKSSLSPVC